MNNTKGILVFKLLLLLCFSAFSQQKTNLSYSLSFENEIAVKSNGNEAQIKKYYQEKNLYCLHFGSGFSFQKTCVFVNDSLVFEGVLTTNESVELAGKGLTFNKKKGCHLRVEFDKLGNLEFCPSKDYTFILIDKKEKGFKIKQSNNCLNRK